MWAMLGAVRLRARSVFLGWKIVAGAVVLQALIAALFQQSYGVYAAFWMEEFGWSLTTISLAYALHRTESALLGPPHGWLLQRYGPRRVILAGVLLLGLGFVALAFVGGIAAFVACYLLMAVGASLASILSLSTVLVNWFERYRARAMSMLATGLSLGGLAIPLVTLALVRFGWRPVAAASGLLILLIGLPVSRLMHLAPEPLGLLPDGAASKGADGTPVQPVAPRPSLSAVAALKTGTFWLISLGHASALMTVSAVLVHYVIFVQGRFGTSVTLAASMLTLMTAASMAGQLVGGFFGDRVEKRLLAGGGMLGHAVALLLLAFASSTAVLVIASLLHGVSWGMRGPLMGAMRADYFGRASFAMIMGTSSLIVTLGSVSGPLLTGLMADATGGYRNAFLMLAATAVAGAVAFFALPSPRAAAARRERPQP